jgi:hypothetical protein
MRPEPMSNGSASVAPSSLNTAPEAVVISADFTCPGVQPGCSARSSAAAPATCGLDIDVP